ncbi:unnamed protein product [Caenorhabditis auriculariae]|uniref:RING-type domain-containing protein n=1 Tax=Caenorhabditis auriculariae TaxID=2777116 RepID=A0A8S1H351_9PELO|nr:unnamed protein product [Caenorhabditis auriculariae]
MAAVLRSEKPWVRRKGWEPADDVRSMQPRRLVSAAMTCRFSFFLLFFRCFGFSWSLPTTFQVKLSCPEVSVSGIFTSNTAAIPTSSFEFLGDICTHGSLQEEDNVLWWCSECAQACPDRLAVLSQRSLVVSKQKAPSGIAAGWFQMSSGGSFSGKCTFSESAMEPPEGSTDALRSFSKTSVLFVSISFIILMVISLAWLVFYYVQRFRYAHAKDRLQRRLFNAARKALARIPTRPVKTGDEELETDCAVCLDPYQLHDIIRILPCKHAYHKSCIDPWLLEHRTCPMCKADILKYFGYQYYEGHCCRAAEEAAGRVELGDHREHDRAILPDEIVSPDMTSGSSDSNGFSFDHPSEHEATFSFTTPVAPQLVLNSNNAKTFLPLSGRATAVGSSREEILPAPTSFSARGHRLSTANSTSSQTDVSISTAGSQRPRSSTGSSTGNGQIVNLVQVKTRAASSTRAATIRKESPPPQPTPIDAVVVSKMPSPPSTAATSLSL